jgi:hypothetical protein
LALIHLNISSVDSKILVVFASVNCLVIHLATELFRDATLNTLMWPVLVKKVVFSVAIMILPLSSWRGLGLRPSAATKKFFL